MVERNMVYQIQYWVREGWRDPEMQHFESTDFQDIEAAKEHASRKVRQSYDAETIPTGAIASFLILRDGKIVYPAETL
jgi:hypothetical protein